MKTAEGEALGIDRQYAYWRRWLRNCMAARDTAHAYGWAWRAEDEEHLIFCQGIVALLEGLD